MTRGTRNRIVIIGGGVSGTLMACHLLRHGAADVRVSLVEKRPGIGYGTAYSTSHPDHLLNVRAANMSAFADDPANFVNWLIERGPMPDGTLPGPTSFAPRQAYGRYINSLVEPLATSGRLDIVSDSVISVSEHADGVAIGLDSGATMAADYAILATGHEEGLAQPSGSCVSPWSKPLSSPGIRHAPVLIVGTGLTMVDVVISLRSQGHIGTIYALSRRGQMPAVHRHVAPLRLETSDIPFRASLLELWTWMRDLAERTEEAGGDWRSVIDAIRPHTWELWQELPLASKQRFLRHARVWWDARRHRMAPAVAAGLEEVIRSGQLRILQARIVALDDRSGGAMVTYRRRGRMETETIEVARIIPCTGVYTDPRQTTNPVVRSLLAHGLARCDPLSVGLEFTTRNALVRADGTPSERIFGAGPITRATFWESLAVPDIRIQCALLAADLRRKIRERATAALRIAS